MASEQKGHHLTYEVVTHKVQGIVCECACMHVYVW